MRPDPIVCPAPSREACKPRTHRRLRDDWVQEEGFSLSELMIVIVIIGILAMLAIPRFMGVTVEAKMTEAKMMLKQLHTLQSAYYYAHDRYAPSLDAVGFQQTRLVNDGGTARYVIAVEQADAQVFVATATSTVDYDKDGTFNVWQIDADGVLTQRTPD